MLSVGGNQHSDRYSDSLKILARKGCGRGTRREYFTSDGAVCLAEYPHIPAVRMVIPTSSYHSGQIYSRSRILTGNAYQPSRKSNKAKLSIHIGSREAMVRRDGLAAAACSCGYWLRWCWDRPLRDAEPSKQGVQALTVRTLRKWQHVQNGMRRFPGENSGLRV